MHPKEIERRVWEAYKRQGGADKPSRPSVGPKQDLPARVMDGNREVKLTPRVKNQMFREAKRVGEQLRSSMLSVTETKRPTNENVEKMLRNEMSGRGKELKDRYKNLMRSQGAYSNEFTTETLRRRK